MKSKKKCFPEKGEEKGRHEKKAYTPLEGSTWSIARTSDNNWTLDKKRINTSWWLYSIAVFY